MDAQAYLGLWCLHIMWDLSWHVSNVSISYCKHSKKMDSKILLHEKKKKKEKLFVGPVGYQYFINFCEGGNLFLYCPNDQGT